DHSGVPGRIDSKEPFELRTGTRCEEQSERTAEKDAVGARPSRRRQYRPRPRGRARVKRDRAQDGEPESDDRRSRGQPDQRYAVPKRGDQNERPYEVVLL